MACQHSPDDQTLLLQAGAGEDGVILLPSGLDRVDCERQEEDQVSTDDIVVVAAWLLHTFLTKQTLQSYLPHIQ